MTQRPDKPRTEWDQYVAWKKLIAEAARRAKETHRERRAQETEEAEANEAARADRAGDAVDTRAERAAESEAEKAEFERRSVDPDAERMALARERYDHAAAARDESLRTAELERGGAISSAAQQAATTSDEHAIESAAAADSNSKEYRSMMAARVEVAARMKEYRSERESEQLKMEDERRAAAALMARQAREARRQRETEEAGSRSESHIDPASARALSALMSRPGSSKGKDATERGDHRKRAAGPAASGSSSNDRRPTEIPEPEVAGTAEDSPVRQGGGLMGWIARAFGRSA